MTAEPWTLWLIPTRAIDKGWDAFDWVLSSNSVIRAIANLNRLTRFQGAGQGMSEILGSSPEKSDDSMSGFDEARCSLSIGSAIHRLSYGAQSILCILRWLAASFT